MVVQNVHQVRAAGTAHCVVTCGLYINDDIANTRALAELSCLIS